MILFTILTITAILLLLFIIVAVSVGGATMLVIFGDVVVCVFIIGLILRFITKRQQ